MKIVDHFVPGAIGTIVQLHGSYYATHWGFGTFFEAKVARELADFADRMTERDLVLFGLDDQGVAASLVLDLNDPLSLDRGAHLRWFMCDARCRGTGIGRDLLARAVTHADTHSEGRMWLTTFAGLSSARHLYESYGFQLVLEEEGAAWGTRVREQEFRREGRRNV